MLAEEKIAVSVPMRVFASQAWLFSPTIDVCVFLGSAIVSLLLLLVGKQLGILDDETPDWMWISAVLMIDVAHVWATNFRVYFDFDELKRKPFLYAIVPIFGYVLGVALYSESAITFWRGLAYLAVFHFVRQQFGWVKLYRAKRGETEIWTKIIDVSTIYLATIYPLVYWQTKLPRNFEWFVQNDFISLPQIVEKIVFPLYVASLTAYFCKTIYLFATKGFVNLGKDIVVATTVICWYIGIVYFNSDYAFTVTNVIIHGVPYFALVYFYAKSRRETATKIYRLMSHNFLFYLSILWLLAYAEELFWHRGIWHEKNWLFGENFELGNLKMYLVPLLALPQLTHYALDGFIWRRKSNENFKLI